LLINIIIYEKKIARYFEKDEYLLDKGELRKVGRPPEKKSRNQILEDSFLLSGRFLRKKGLKISKK